MHQLAAEFGGAPSLRTLALRSPRVLVLTPTPTPNPNPNPEPEPEPEPESEP